RGKGPRRNSRSGLRAGHVPGAPLESGGRVLTPDRTESDRMTRSPVGDQVRDPAHDPVRDRLRAHAPQESARRARRWGPCYIAEHRIKSMRGYLWTILVSGFGTPVVYLFGLGVGLAAVVDAGPGAEIDGIGYLTFVAPALLVAATMMTATEEFTYPIMDG